jgi:hypothetical protein
MGSAPELRLRLLVRRLIRALGQIGDRPLPEEEFNHPLGGDLFPLKQLNHLGLNTVTGKNSPRNATMLSLARVGLLG